MPGAEGRAGGGGGGGGGAQPCIRPTKCLLTSGDVHSYFFNVGSKSINIIRLIFLISKTDRYIQYLLWLVNLNEAIPIQ